MDIFEKFDNYCCPLCEPDGVPRGFTTWFRVRPESAQALHNLGAGEKANYERAIRAEITKHGYQMTWDLSGKKYPLNTFDPKNVYGKRKPDEPPVQLDVCVGLLFGLSQECLDKDVDNMTKLFLDALKGADGLVHDDSAVVHLNVTKRLLIPAAPTTNNYLVGVRVTVLRSTMKREINFTWHSNVEPILI